ncbi:MAG TPA: ATP-binding protein [Candidatus Acidoferrum sp.]|nr:ATP-binding protein [Candidatus Acidoferrum sp.]
MPEPNSLSRGRRVYVYLALALLLTHAAVLIAGPEWSARGLLSNLTQIACPLLAAAACVAASRRLQNFGKHFWLLFAAGFVVWACAQTVATYYDSILREPVQQPWPSDIIFFLSLSLPFMILFIDQRKGFEWKQWPRIFDLAQVLILMLAVYLFTFDTPEAWRDGWGALGRLAWVPETSRDILLVSSFALASLFGKSGRSRYLYGKMGIFFFVYLIGEFPYLFLQSNQSLRTGSPLDLVWSVPFLVAAVIAAVARPELRAEEPAGDGGEAAPRSARWALAHVASLVFPLVILLMAAGIAERQLLAAAVLVILSFSCSVGRILFAEQQQAQAALELRESNALLQSVFEGTGDGIFIKDRQGRCIIANGKFAELCGMTVDEVIGKTTVELVGEASAKALVELDQLVMASGGSKSIEHELRLNDGVHSFLTTKSPRLDANGKIVGVIGVVRDITEYQRMEERLRQSQKMEAIGTLAGGVAHDFNNLLMVISGYSSVLAEALAADTKLRGHVDQILKAGERAASLTRQLLAFSRKQTIQPTPLSMNQIITGIEKLLHRLIGEDIRVETRLEADLGTVMADAGQMEQVILNLAVNARDAMPKGGNLVFETRNVELGDSIADANNLKPGRYIEFVVSDTGTGMDLSVQTRLFEPFFTTKPTGKGTGLGLSTVYGILKQANGHISFTSQPGHGTTFRIFLPRIDTAMPSDGGAAEKVAALNGRETVLIVEDDAAVCELVRAVLDSHGYTVLTAARAQEAEQLFARPDCQIDLMISDVVMPDISGTDLAKRLAEKKRGLKVLFMSGYIGDAIVRTGISEKDVAFLQKPFAPITLVKKVREVLDGTRVREG